MVNYTIKVNGLVITFNDEDVRTNYFVTNFNFSSDLDSNLPCMTES